MTTKTPNGTIAPYNSRQRRFLLAWMEGVRLAEQARVALHELGAALDDLRPTDAARVIPATGFDERDIIRDAAYSGAWAMNHARNDLEQFLPWPLVRIAGLDGTGVEGPEHQRRVEEERLALGLPPAGDDPA